MTDCGGRARPLTLIMDPHTHTDSGVVGARGFKRKESSSPHSDRYCFVFGCLLLLRVRACASHTYTRRTDASRQAPQQPGLACRLIAGRPLRRRRCDRNGGNSMPRDGQHQSIGLHRLHLLAAASGPLHRHHHHAGQCRHRCRPRPPGGTSAHPEAITGRRA